MHLPRITLIALLSTGLAVVSAVTPTFASTAESVPVPAPVSANLDPETLSNIDTCVSSALDSQGAPGGALALVLEGELALHREYGVRDIASGRPVTPETLFRPGSVQKMMTAAAVLLQIQHGRLALHDSVRTLVPELAFAGPWPTSAITVEDLLTHTSGIPDMSDPLCSESLSEWAGTLGQVPLFAPAGAFFNYTNAGYSLAGLVAERAGGQPFAELMSEHVWRPAKMEATFQSPAEAIAYGDVAWGHDLDPETGELTAFPPDTFECPWAGPSGDFFTTASDLARFAMLLMEGGREVLAPEMTRLLLDPAVATLDDPAESYGYGVFTREVEGEQVHYHSGGVPGGSSHVLWLPERGWAVSVVANRAVGLSAAAKCVLETTEGVTWPGDPAPTSPASWRRFRGVYLVRTIDADVFPLLVWMKDRRLRVTGVSPLTSEITTWIAVPVGPDAFWIDLDGDGEAGGLELISFVLTAGGTRGSSVRGRSVWLRHRLFVGQRLLPFWARNALEASALLHRASSAMAER